MIIAQLDPRLMIFNICTQLCVLLYDVCLFHSLQEVTLSLFFYIFVCIFL
jgi:hypothetical protein